MAAPPPPNYFLLVPHPCVSRGRILLSLQLTLDPARFSRSRSAGLSQGEASHVVCPPPPGAQPIAQHPSRRRLWLTNDSLEHHIAEPSLQLQAISRRGVPHGPDCNQPASRTWARLPLRRGIVSGRTMTKNTLGRSVATAVRGLAGWLAGFSSEGGGGAAGCTRGPARLRSFSQTSLEPDRARRLTPPVLLHLRRQRGGNRPPDPGAGRAFLVTNGSQRSRPMPLRPPSGRRAHCNLYLFETLLSPLRVCPLSQL